MRDRSARHAGPPASCAQELLACVVPRRRRRVAAAARCKKARLLDSQGKGTEARDALSVAVLRRAAEDTPTGGRCLGYRSALVQSAACGGDAALARPRGWTVFEIVTNMAPFMLFRVILMIE